ncbi:acyl-CoA thioesterase [uncultured Sunxiuqinia sp.]|uniref:acyl-CoA thioesterase n=1 Tax=uncultured Sunxiuqinia sp. TaxID=1573825 RepID=UPI002AA8EC8C|nr:acyl-CoA thioesterase [uncultured Sunxiuqinia sp.]
MDYSYELQLKVRDYECDLQGIVNNAVYQNYLEHTRHEFIEQAGLSFAKLHEDGIDAIVIRIEIDYKFPLRSGDEFVCRLKLSREGNLKFVFWQDIYRLPDEKLIVKGKVTTATVNNRTARPVAPTQLVEALEKYMP